jgi:uncharacterized protein (TIGR02266 family)
MTAAVARTLLIGTADVDVRERFADALRQAGHRAVVVGTWAALRSALVGESPAVDLVLLDIALGDGPALVTSIREQAGNLPVLIFSGSLRGAAHARTLAGLGVTGYVNEYCDADHILPALAPHLFPDSFNRRANPRVDLAVPVSYRVDDVVAAALTLNIGPGGLAIRTMNPLDVAITVRARFRLPGSTTEIEADSRVVWRDRRVGMGLQFERVEPSDQAAIDEYVDQRNQGGSTPTLRDSNP